MYSDKMIKNGDLIGITRFDFIDQIIQVGTQSRIGHTAIALWEGDQLYICESQMALYWPRLNI